MSASTSPPDIAQWVGPKAKAPIAACLALGALAAIQVLIPTPLRLPDDAVVLPRRLPAIRATPIAKDPSLDTSPLFSPSRAAGGGDSGAFGYSLAGVAQARGYAVALIRKPDGGTAMLRRGQSIEGWRISAVGVNGVLMTRGAERRVLMVTTPGSQSAGAALGADDDQNQTGDDE